MRSCCLISILTHEAAQRAPGESQHRGHGLSLGIRSPRCVGRGAGGTRPDRPEEGRRRGPLTPRERGSRDRSPGRRVSFGFPPCATRQRVPDFALGPIPRSGGDSTAGLPMLDQHKRSLPPKLSLPVMTLVGALAAAQGLWVLSCLLSHSCLCGMPSQLSSPPSKLLLTLPRLNSEITSLEKTPRSPQVGNHFQVLP